MQSAQRWLFAAGALAAAAALLLGGAVHTATAQIDPTDQNATVQAAIEGLLTATADAVGVGVTQTFEARQAAATGTAQVAATSAAQTQAAATPNLTRTIDAGLRGTVVAITQEAVAVRANEALVAGATDMLYIPGGTFQMGTTIGEVAEAVRECTEVYNASCLLSYGEDAIPTHEVTLDPYQIDLYEVSYAQYVTFLNGAGPGSHLNGCNGVPCASTQNEDSASALAFDGTQYFVAPFAGDLPAASITWDGAAAYCSAIGRRLPTEAEWEYAARGDDGRIYPWGGPFDVSFARTRADDTTVTVPVDAYFVGASPFGVLNMAGNVAEWTADWYAPDTYSGRDGVENPIGPDTGAERVLRGGSWDAMPFFARSVHRQFLSPGFAAPWVGFRCASDADVVPRNVTPTPTPSPTVTPTPTPND